MKRRRNDRTMTPEEVICHFCREPGNGRSPYRVFAPDPWPRGTRFLVCGPNCRDLPRGETVFSIVH